MVNSNVRTLIVGTAGHVDHGKSSLVRALTGTDPDRLAEERRRGITIELGFAHLDLDTALSISFVDVPGHERFVHNMLAGAHGIDAALLVVAADEAVKPQTREHLDICRLLGVPCGIVALTKCDLAPPEAQAAAEGQVRELVRGSFLEGAPVLRVSARTGAGLDRLVAALAELPQDHPKRDPTGLLRLPIDRVFSLKGFGTVATGTLVSGTLVLGQELQAFPGERVGRVRGLHWHGQSVERLVAGQRAAVNLGGLEPADLRRGDVLARPASLTPSAILDVKLEILKGAWLEEQQRLRIHIQSAEVFGRLRLLGPTRLSGGASGLGQLRLERPMVVGRGDRLILRHYSPARTLGGATVLDPLAPRRRHAERGSLEALLACDTDKSAATLMVAQAGRGGLTIAGLAARLTIEPVRAEQLVTRAPEIVVVGAHCLATRWIEQLEQASLQALAGFHAREPLAAGLPRELLRQRVFAGAATGALDAVLARLLAARSVRSVGADQWALVQHAVALSPAEESARRELLQLAQAAGYRGLDPQAPPRGVERATFERVQRLLLSQGTLQRVGKDALVQRDQLEALKHELRQRFAPGARIEVKVVKDLTGLSRKYVIPLLEYLDRERVTRRSGDERVLVA